ncbi:MAG: hypothetical protein A3F41_04310 [Coxiella sp. RIFCSPHIGHO2_12_FULL_44_14]|nr:MAG: hypothetical protein A3F41_04310 [Coxiella sp. RIFCSPHIGHO2_12_FULL_44_14]
METEFVFPLAERIDFSNVVSLRREGERHLLQHARVTFDFSAVTVCDSSALALLVAWKRFAHHHQVGIHFINVTPSLKMLASVCNVQGILALV